MIHSCDALGSEKINKNMDLNNGYTILNRRVSVDTCVDKPFDGHEQRRTAASPHVSHVKQEMIAAEICCAFQLFFFFNLTSYSVHVAAVTCDARCASISRPFVQPWELCL